MVKIKGQLFVYDTNHIDSRTSIMTQPQPQPAAAPMAQAMQYLLSHGCVTSDELAEFLVTTRPSDRGRSSQSQLTDGELNKAVNNLSDKLKMFDMMIRSAYDPNTRKRYYALISTVDNDITRKASHYTEKEFEYFRLVWEKIQTDPCKLDDLYTIGKNLKLTNYKNLINEWTEKHWLYKDGDKVKLGIRSELELDVLKSVNKPSTSGVANQSANRMVVEDGDDVVIEEDEDEDED